MLKKNDPDSLSGTYFYSYFNSHISEDSHLPGVCLDFSHLLVYYAFFLLIPMIKFNLCTENFPLIPKKLKNITL